jgi:hypothetical protein
MRNPSETVLGHYVPNMRVWKLPMRNPSSGVTAALSTVPASFGSYL